MSQTTDRTDTTAPPGFTLPCPVCGAEEANIAVRLAQLHEDAFICCDCDVEFSVEFVRNLMARWAVVLNWVEQAPRFPSPE